MTNAEARFNNSLRPRKPEGSLGRTAQDVHLDSHTAPELWWGKEGNYKYISDAILSTPESIYLLLRVDGWLNFFNAELLPKR